MKRQLMGILLSASVLAAGSSAAFGLSYTGTKYGSEIRTYGSVVTLRDNQDDGQFPSVNYSFDNARQSSGFSNKSGYGTVVKKNAGSRVNGIQPCVSRSWPLPSSCGGWIGTPPK